MTCEPVSSGIGCPASGTTACTIYTTYPIQPFVSPKPTAQGLCIPQHRCTFRTPVRGLRVALPYTCDAMRRAARKHHTTQSRQAVLEQDRIVHGEAEIETYPRTRQVHHARPREVSHAAANQQIPVVGPKRARPAAWGPHPVGHNGVYQGSYDYSVYQVWSA